MDAGENNNDHTEEDEEEQPEMNGKILAGEMVCRYRLIQEIIKPFISVPSSVNTKGR